MTLEDKKSIIAYLRDIDNYTKDIKEYMAVIEDKMSLCGYAYVDILRIIAKDE